MLPLREQTSESGLFTEGSFVLIDGYYTIDSTFKVSEIGHPPSEKRSSAMSIFGHHDFLGLGGVTPDEEVRSHLASLSSSVLLTSTILRDLSRLSA